MCYLTSLGWNFNFDNMFAIVPVGQVQLQMFFAQQRDNLSTDQLKLL